jgi:hypothetical protein
MNPYRILTALAALMLLATLAQPAFAGSAEAPEVTDPAGDEVHTNGSLVGTAVPEQAFDDVDILAAWLQDDGTTLTITVLAVGDATATTNVTVTFKVQPGPTSLAGSTASGTEYAAWATGATVNDGAPAGTNVTQAGNTTIFTIPLASIGAVGGDLITGLKVATSNSDGGTFPPPITQDDQSATDETEGALNYTLTRGPIVPGVKLTITGGTATEGGTDRTFTGADVTTTNASAKAVYTVEVENTGSDKDGVTLSIANAGALAGKGATASLDKTSLALDPGQKATAKLTVQLNNAEAGKISIDVSATSVHGATATKTASMTVNKPGTTPTTTTTTTGGNGTPPADDERDPVLAVGFLTTMAEGMGLDETFGDWAEVAVLGLILLLLLIVVFLLLFLRRSGWVKIKITPGALKAAPGESAEFQVEVENKKKRAFQTRLHFDLVDPTWKTGVLLTQEDGATLDPLTSSDQELEFTMNGRLDPGKAYTGTLRVKVPEDAADRERNEVTVTVIPVDEEGQEILKQKNKARVRVQSDHAMIQRPPEIVPNVRLAKVEHNPIDPEPGEQVETRAFLENDDSDRTWVLRVILNVDGADLQEQIVAVPAQKARAVIFTWTATGENHVRVLVFEKKKGDAN